MRFRPPRRGRTSRYELGMGVGLGSYGATQSFTPLSLAPSLWLDASVASSLFQNSNGTTAATADGDPVGYWADLSGNARHVTQATGTKRPALKLAIQNGRNVVRGDGVDDTMIKTGLSISQPYTVFIAAQWPTVGDRPVIDGGGASNRLLVRREGTNKAAWNTGTEIAGTTLSSGWHVFTALGNGASSLLRVDGALNVAGNAGAQSITALTLLAYFNGSNPSAIDIGEIIVLPADATVNFSQVEAYLRSKWGTP